MTGAANLDTVLGKAVTILRAFRPDDHAVPLATLVARTGLHKATVHRLAGELVANRLLDRVEGGYRLSGGLFELGMLASLERSLLEMAMPFLQDLYERTHETVHLGVRDGHDVVYIAKIGGHRQANSPSRTGGRIPLYCTAIGKALLAYSDPEFRREVLAAPMTRRTPHTIVAPGILSNQLDRVFETGVAFEREESAPGLTCVAAPVFGSNDKLVAAISVTGPTTRFKPESQVTVLRAAAEGLRSTMARREHLR
ncbi:IclR family transcriptional regulator [Rhodococcus sp. ACPA4]|uniref:IclR family transcriptional regulator n=2 Tax=Nocardiaceae TaxID=85025 RepID=A0A652YHZ5_NOCGL|nr:MULTISPECIES: IclR family transcriptional regulator [Rhodococcus]NMD60407.1 IclR family transcriptional regulator [Nocardia globerula]KJF24039.1 Pectin degradation repressor protein kdgR [Rhodococcus sp. AD45]MCE4268786.1 IclR family transcriptional regulator [Rhodococcus globerulus]MDV6270281.1 IclR family transcriptional regulator [Rhodococcus globerulus]MDV8069480.1 IclR family transcriptional regulator [Rhodococcus sp. IEGM 1366]